MEEELKCPVCHCLFAEPIILPCSHNVCLGCAETLIIKSRPTSNEQPTSFPTQPPKEQSHPNPDSDKISVISEAVLSDSDSGYSAGSSSSNGGSEKLNSPQSGTSAPMSKLGPFLSQRCPTPPVPVTMPTLPDSVSCLTCPICHRTLFLDDRGARGLDENKLMTSIVTRFVKNKDESVKPPKRNTVTSLKPATVETKFCELCDVTKPMKASVKCLQCEVLYCRGCRDRCHPPRGPLAKHALLDVNTEQQRVSDVTTVAKKPFPALPSKPMIKNGLRLATCPQHPTESTSLHCERCRASLCVQCQGEGKHQSHPVRPIGALYKAQKTVLSQNMSSLSNKARQAKDLVMKLRGTQAEIEKSADDVEKKTIAQCDLIIGAMQRKKDELLQTIQREKELKCKGVREQLQQCTMKLKQTTGLLEYCIEVMKDNDASAFLQISQSLTERVALNEQQWSLRSLQSKTEKNLHLDLHCSGIALLIDQIEYSQIKVPDKPMIKVEECGSKNNTVTLAWTCKKPNNASTTTNTSNTSVPVDGFKLEMDDGSHGAFREVYCGKETVCTVDGLHFNSVYRARVRAFNKAGHSPNSDLLHLQTSEVASFQLGDKHQHSDVTLSNNNTTVTSSNLEDRVVVGNVGFSRGIHYWEFSIDAYDTRGEPRFGVGRSDVSRDGKLGEDDKGWSLGATEGDRVRRWEAQLEVGSRVGVLLDLAHKAVTFFVDGTAQGTPLSLSLSTNNPYSVYYPAVSFNQYAQVTLHTGLRCPVTAHQPQLYRNRIQSLPEQPRSRSPARRRGPPPAPPLRKGGSSGNVSLTSNDGSTTKTFRSFFQKR